ncbi:MAG TPA: GNAT family N-acetyltransferase [Nocardioides sp.]|nr:GNAT family N-acetyltransferase [Nocardioides sp.]
MLGPHVVGQRVVVRRLVPGETGPTGGPAFTDLLGTCLSWDDEVCVVQPEDGPAVPIPVELIVSGKPVPPRPSVRGRVSARDLELRTAGLWERVLTVPLGEWVLRNDPAPVGRPRRRATSCLAMGDPGMPLTEALAQVTDFYDGIGRPACLQVEADGDVEAGVRELGWQEDPTGEAELRIASVARVRRRLAAAPAPVELTVSGDRAVASIGTGCDPIAEGEAYIDGDWLGVHSLTVDPGHRRRGHATALMAELLEWGAERGALTAWLHVETSNTAARALYDGLGFDVHHVCRYFTPAG